ncbi:DNA-directed DNA polymerase [Powellomyces hirtus]|uniref:DNA-directed DNA polymerase n=1 Tax=Powellomyces hirtus TaxID=109895 RepID=A0A507DMR9_9FUNG|nr:DNA-directed DNA polymerase [Powellomyces hirtus]
MLEHINKVKMIGQQLEAIEAKVDSGDIVTTLLYSLPESFGSLLVSLESRAGDLTLEFLTAGLLHEETCLSGGQDCGRKDSRAFYGRSQISSATMKKALEQQSSEANQGSGHEAFAFGASQHMTSNRAWLSNLQPLNNARVHLAENRIVEATEKGTATIQTALPHGRMTPCTFKDVWLVPKLKRSLLSVAQVEGAGANIQFVGPRCEIKTTYASILKENQHKLGPSATRCIFLGYSQTTKGYRLWDEASGKLIESRDVRFDEESLAGGDKLDGGSEQGEDFEDAQEHQPSLVGAIPSAPRKPKASKVPERSSTCIRRPPREYWKSGTGLLAEATGLLAEAIAPGEDKQASLKAALKAPDARQWEQAAQTEPDSLHANHTWDLLLDAHLKQLGFVQINADNCIYTLHAQDPKSALFLLVYVDGMILACKSMVQFNRIKTELSKQFKMTDMDALGLFLRMLASFGMDNCKPVSTPMETSTRLTKAMEPQSDEERAMMASTPYRSAVGSVIYGMLGTRLDLAASVGSVSQFMANPGPGHWQAVKRIMRYVSGSLDAVLELGGSFRTAPDLEGYSDSDWAGCPDSRCSTTAFVFIFGGPVAWQSKRQPTVALSSTEAEYMALTQACKEANWLRQLLIELGYPQGLPCKIYEENQGCIALARNPTSHARTKHIDIRHHFIREAIANQHRDLEYCPTKDMAADLLTKPLPSPQFAKLFS